MRVVCRGRGVEMSDEKLRADIIRIRKFSHSLKNTHDQFNSSSSPVKDHESALGSSQLTDAFDDFWSNWKIHREHLAKELKILYGILKKAADTYEKADSDLAEALRKANKKAHKKD